MSEGKGGKGGKGEIDVLLCPNAFFLFCLWMCCSRVWGFSATMAERENNVSWEKRSTFTSLLGITADLKSG